MRRNLTRRTVLGSIGAGAITLGLVGPAAAGENAQYVVTATGAGTRDRIESAGFEVSHELAGGDVLGVVGPESDRDALASVAGVSSVARNYRFRWDGPEDLAAPDSDTTDDAFYGEQWDKQVTDVAEAHETATGDGTTLAVLDTGVDMDHPDLPNVDPGASRLFRYGGVYGGTGEVEFPADVFDFSAGTTTVSRHLAGDVEFHGTHVAGIAGASHDGTTGMVGTAPDADVVSLRVFYYDELDYDVDGDGEVEEDAAALVTTNLDIWQAIEYAAAIGADAANMSLGTPPLPPQLNAGGIRAAEQKVVQSAVERGTVVVAAAGNDDTDLQHGGTFLLPASVPGAMAVSATGPNDRRSFYSNYGTTTVDVGAPGGGYETLAKTLSENEEGDPTVEWPYPSNFVLSTADPDSVVGQQYGGALYIYSIGTSMATPQVAGTVGLVREVAPDANPEQVEQAIEQGADLVAGKNDDELGAGRLNAAGALDAPGVR